jgi:hypothetical protein
MNHNSIHVHVSGVSQFLNSAFNNQFPPHKPFFEGVRAILPGVADCDEGASVYVDMYVAGRMKGRPGRGYIIQSIHLISVHHQQ